MASEQGQDRVTRDLLTLAGCLNPRSPPLNSNDFRRPNNLRFIESTSFLQINNREVMPKLRTAHVVDNETQEKCSRF